MTTLSAASASSASRIEYSGKSAECQLERPGKVSGTVFVRQRKRLLFAQTELALLFVIRDVAAGGY